MLHLKQSQGDNVQIQVTHSNMIVAWGGLTQTITMTDRVLVQTADRSDIECSVDDHIKVEFNGVAENAGAGSAVDNAFREYLLSKKLTLLNKSNSNMPSRK